MPDANEYPDELIVRHTETGQILRLAAGDYAANLATAEAHGWERYDPPKDGFRKPKRRPKGWMKKAIEEGVIADPAIGPEEHRVYPPETFVIDVPIARFEAAGKETG